MNINEIPPELLAELEAAPKLGEIDVARLWEATRKVSAELEEEVREYLKEQEL
jgi:hypothetical protein